MTRYGSSAGLAAAPGALRYGVLGALGVLVAAAVVFYATQNTGARIGGEIAPQKMLWLLHAVFLWLVLPLAIACDARADRGIRAVFLALFVLMALRGAIEMWMLYVSHNWSPWYGIAHDLLCLSVLLVGLQRALRLRAGAAATDRWLLVHLAVTAAAFLPEIYFAHYMAENFNTAGEAAIYFVPDDPRHATVLRVTTGAVAALSLYLPVFLWRWLGDCGRRA